MLLMQITLTIVTSLIVLLGVDWLCRLLIPAGKPQLRTPARYLAVSFLSLYVLLGALFAAVVLMGVGYETQLITEADFNAIAEGSHILLLAALPFWLVLSASLERTRLRAEDISHA